LTGDGPATGAAMITVGPRCGVSRRIAYTVSVLDREARPRSYV